MFQHLRAVLLATAALVVLGSMHTLSTAIARPVPSKPALRSEPERVSSAAVSGLIGASLRSVSIGF